MPTFTYEALNAAGKPQKGTIDANSTDEALQRIATGAATPMYRELLELSGRKRLRPTDVPAAIAAGIGHGFRLALLWHKHGNGVAMLEQQFVTPMGNVDESSVEVIH